MLKKNELTEINQLRDEISALQSLVQAKEEVIERQHPANLLLVCSGTHDQTAYEDVLGAGALCDLLWAKYSGGGVADSALIARRLFRLEQDDLLAAVAQSRNGRRLMTLPDLREDVAFCVQRDRFKLVAEMGKDGVVQAQRPAGPNLSPHR